MFNLAWNMKEGCQISAEPEKAGQNRYFLDVAAICGKSSNKSHKIYDVMVFV